MVIFILAAAAAFLLCALIDKGSPAEERSPGSQDKQSPEDKFAKWLSKKAHILPSILLLFLAAAVLFMLVAAAAGPREFGFFLLSLPILILFWGMWSLGNIPSRSEKIKAVEWRLLVISPLALVALFEREDIAALVPEFIVRVAKWLGSVSWLGSVLLWLSSALPWFLAACTWLIAGAFYASLTNSANRPFKWLRGPWKFKWLPEQWQKHLVLGSLLFIALFSTLIAWNGDAWAYAMLLTSRHVISMPETIHALLGVVAGLMCGNFSRWMTYAQSWGKAETSKQSQPVDGIIASSRQADKTESEQAHPAPGSPGNGDRQPPRNGQLPKPVDESAGKAPSEIWPMIIFAGALSLVLLAALVGPYAQSAMSHVSGLETPYLKVQFAIPLSLADKEQVLNVERDLNYLDTLEEFPRNFRFLQYDCAQAALDAGIGITQFKLDKPDEYAEFTTELAFEQSLLPYVNQLVNAKRKEYNRVVLNARARQVAEKFAPLATKENFEKHDRAAMFKFEENYLSALSEVERQKQLFEEEGVRADLPEEEKLRRRDDPDPKYCWPSDEDIKLASDRFDIRNARNTWMVAQKRPRPIFDLAVALFHFEGDTPAENAMRMQIFNLNTTTDDINTLGAYSAAHYIGGNDLSEVIRLRQADLQIVESRLGMAERAKIWTQEQVEKVSTREIDNKAHSDLVRRYKRARFLDRLRLAYLWSQHGLSAEGDLLPERDLHWSSALRYADDAYEALLNRSKSPPRFACMDDDLDLQIKDTYAFVKLAYQAYNLKNRRILPDEFLVRRAREILEDALAEAREQHRRLLEAAPSCFIAEATKAWIKRISGHMRLADALQP